MDSQSQQKQQNEIRESKKQQSGRATDAQGVDPSLKAAVEQNAAEPDDRSTTKASDPSQKG